MQKYTSQPFQPQYHSSAVPLAPQPAAPSVEQACGPKVKEPTLFAGTDPTKLWEFLMQCILTFNADPSRYQREESQVMFAASYLTETTASWFQLFLLAPSTPLIIFNWQEFVSELTQMFGDLHLAST